MSEISLIPNRIRNASVDPISGNRLPVTGASDIYDDELGMSQAEINRRGGEDREIDPTNFVSTGGVVIQNNIVDIGGINKNILTQDAFLKEEDGELVMNESNIFYIKNDFELGETSTDSVTIGSENSVVIDDTTYYYTEIEAQRGKNITLPSGCVFLNSDKTEAGGTGKTTTIETTICIASTSPGTYTYSMTPWITIPMNSVLKFEGGSISGILNSNTGAITGVVNIQNGRIDAPGMPILHNVIVYGNAAYEINARWYGFMPTNDGDTNAAAFVNMLKVGAYQGRNLAIYIPNGTYYMRGVDYHGVGVYINLRGDSQTNTIIRIDPEDTESLYLLYLGINYSRISDITFRGHLYNWSQGAVASNPNTKLFSLVRIEGFGNIFDRCSFKGSPGHGIFISGANTPTFNDCAFMYNWGFGAFVMSARGAIFNNPWVELNWQGGIIHFAGYSYGNSWVNDNIIIVRDGATENNGGFGVKGTATGYKGTQYEYNSGFVILDGTGYDFVENTLGYCTSNNNKNIVIKNAKYKYATLPSDMTLQFVDPQWNDFIVYERNGVLNITFEKTFQAGDIIRLYDFQQDVTADLSWTDGEYGEGNMHTILSAVRRKAIITFDPNINNENTTLFGNCWKVYNAPTSNYRLVNYMERCDDANLAYVLPGGTDGTNPIFIGQGYISPSAQGIINPGITLSNFPDFAGGDLSNVYMYIFGRGFGYTKVGLLARSATDIAYPLGTNGVDIMPNGDYCAEFKLGDLTSTALGINVTMLQISMQSIEPTHRVYGIIYSTKRFPKLPD